MKQNTYLCITSSSERFTLKVEVSTALQYGPALLTLSFPEERRSVFIQDDAEIFGDVLNLVEAACLFQEVPALKKLHEDFGLKEGDVCELWDLFIEARGFGIWQEEEGALPTFSEN
jgi:hypothetical protein